MKNRSSYAVLTRFGILGALLATLAFIAPVVFANAFTYDYPENGTDPVATLSAKDADGDEIEWSLTGVDKDDFTIEGGVLAFKTPPNYEKPTDRDEIPDEEQVGDQGAGDRVYKITVNASGGTQDVEVTVTNVDEDGSVSFTQPQPQVSREIEAMFSDDDGKTDPTWQWSMGPTATGPWTDIDGATTAKRNPGTDEEGNYLRATVSYTDSFGAQTASGVTENPVEERTLSNSAPRFVDIEPIAINENETGDIGDPVVATDADNDVLLYTKGTLFDTDGTTALPNDNDLFNVGRTTGQLSIVSEDGLNFEIPGGDPAKTANTDATDDIPDGVIVYTVVITATDPSGASGTEAVSVYLSDVNEAPVFTGDTDKQTTLYIAENAGEGFTGSPANGLFTNKDLASDHAVDPYQATDPDDQATDPDDADSSTIYRLEGAGSDEKSFTLEPSTGALTYTLQNDANETVNANFEAKSSYSLVVIASDGDGDREMHTRLGVTVKVVDGEDGGTVGLSAPEPQIGKAVVATLTEPDGGVTDLVWQWFRSLDDDTATTDLTTMLETDTSREENLCDADNAVATGDPCVIDSGKGPVYTPVDDDEDAYLYAYASYKDNQGDDTEYASGKPTRVVQDADPANTAPKFPDQDLVTAGDQSDTAMRSVAENAKGADVGAPVTADDADGDLRQYSLSGDDASMFSVDKDSGLIKTATELNFEADDEHTVTLTATDPSGATDSIMVVITVTDANDPPVISGADAVTIDEGTTAVASFTATDEDGDDIEWAVDVDPLEKDGGSFEISDDGVLTFKSAPNYEAMADKDEDKDSLGDQGAGDNIYRVVVKANAATHEVAVTVTNVNEDGSVTFDQPQPQATRNLKADFSDQDGKSEPSWQWSRSESKEGPWTDIEGETKTNIRPSADDVDNYLRATVTYTDSFGEQTASGVTDRPVEARTLANAAPKFKDDIVIEANENMPGNIGDPVTASDADNDVLLYSKGTLTEAQGDAIANDNDLFDISKSGQISIKGEDGFNFESPVPTDRATDPANSNNGIPDGALIYIVVITATDPSGATDTEAITVAIKNVNEAPEFNAESKAKKTLWVIENTGTEVALRQGEAADSERAGSYTAADEDTADDDIDYTLEAAGDIEDMFTLGEDTGTIGLADGFAADFEDTSSYALTIVAEGTGTDRPTLYTRLPITVKVVNTEDNGTVTLNAREPQVGRPVVATLDDKDGGVTEVSWRWFRGGESVLDATDRTIPATIEACDDDSPAADNTNTCEIAGAAGSALYTPGDADVDKTIHAVATYKDSQNKDTFENAAGPSEFPVQESDPANTAPVFADQDLNTAGDQSEMAVRSVMENMKGASVGEPIAVDDPDGDAMMLDLIGDDADLFSVDNSGLIKTAVGLDYEALPEDAKYHMVTLIAIDPSGASDTIMVRINVEDGDDGAVITAGPLVPAEPADPDSACVTGGAVEDASNGGLTSDCEILLAGMAELVGDGTALNWSAETKITEWDGVAAGTGRVVSIYLRGHGLAGQVPAGFNGLSALTRLQLHDNDLMGGIPDLSDLDLLEWLILQDNSLSGSIPATLAGMDNLDYLYLKNNDLSGGIPIELTGVSTLRRVDLRGNDLTGGIPGEFGSIARLRYLMLSGNELTGTIPAELGDSENMVLLYLAHNDLSGSIPAELGSITTLRRLQLHSNSLSGDVPAELGNLTELANLMLAGNMLTGCIPAEVFGVSDAAAAGLAACPADDGS